MAPKGGRRRRRAAIAVAVAVLGAGLGSADGARGATYTVESCTTPSSLNAGWRAETHGDYVYTSNACTSDGYFEGYFTPPVAHADGDFAYFVFSAPPGVKVQRLSGERSTTSGPFRDYGNAVGILIADGRIIEDCQRFYGCANRLGRVDFDLGGAAAVSFGAQCAGTAGCPAGETAYRLRDVRLTLSDDANPTITASPTGTLIDPSNRDRQRALAYSASDVGSGVYRHRLIVDNDLKVNEVVNGNDGKCSPPFVIPVPCRTSAVAGAINFDTSALGDGPHTAKLEVRDATDTNAVATAPWTFVVDNKPPTVSEAAVAGVARVGDTLACKVTVAGESPTLTFTWMRAADAGTGRDEIAGATGQTYVVRPQDEGERLRCSVKATDHGGTASRDSDATVGKVVGAGGSATTQPAGSAASALAASSGGTVVNPGGGAAASGSGGSSGGGNSGVGGPQTLIVTNPVVGSGPNGTPAAADALLSSRFLVGSGRAVRSRTSLVAGYSQTVRVKATLKTPAGAPIVGARVHLVSRTLNSVDAQWRVGGNAVTGPDGSAVLSLGRGGRSAEVRAVYFPTDGSNANRGSNGLSLRRRQDATLKVSSRSLRNGGLLRLSGRVLGTIPARGQMVRIQVRLGRTWFTFAKRVTRRAGSGRFTASHRFTRTTRSITYRFRALVLPSDRRMYTSGYSPSINVRVRP